MTFEASEQTIRSEAEHIREKNAMQIELADRLYGGKNNELFIDEWIPKYSKRFRELFENEIATDPDFFTKLADPIGREVLLKKFEVELYGE